MSQLPMPAPPLLAPPASAPPAAPRRRRSAPIGTPRLLRVAGVAAFAVCLLFGFSTAGAAASRSSALGDARNHAAQLVRIQSIRSNLTQADAAATNAFLVGGLEPVDQRASYTAGIAGATAAIASAAAGSTADAPVLAKTNQLLAQYAGLIESARANNRQGFPIGSAYLRQASNLLRLQVLPPLARLVTAEQARVTNAYDNAAQDNDALVPILVLAIVVLVIIQIWLSARTHRTLNRGLAGATAIVALVGLIGIALMTTAQHKADDVRAGSLAATDAIATARTDGFAAKSAESLTLINRGSGQPFEAEYKTEIADASTRLQPALIDHRLTTLLDAYNTAHVAVRTKDDGGNWDAAVSLATSNDPQGTKVAFAAFAAASKTDLAAEAASATAGLNSAKRGLDALAGFLILAGVAAAVLAWRGIALRLREYR